MRELIEKISLLTTGEDWAHGDGMNQLVPVRRAYEALTQGQGFNESFSLDNSKEQVVTLIRKLSGYFEWEAVNRPQLRKKIAQTLSALFSREEISLHALLHGHEEKENGMDCGSCSTLTGAPIPFATPPSEVS
jgi:hypothetical protein